MMMILSRSEGPQHLVTEGYGGLPRTLRSFEERARISGVIGVGAAVMMMGLGIAAAVAGGFYGGSGGGPSGTQVAGFVRFTEGYG